MAERIMVRGSVSEPTEERRQRDEDLAFEGGIEVQVKAVIDVSALGRDSGDVQTMDLDDDDVIESRDADDWVSFTTVKALRDRTSGDRSARVDGALDLITALSGDPHTRGGRDLKEVTAYAAKLPANILDELNILERLAGKAIDLAADPAARLAARKVVDWLERPVPDSRVGEDKTYGKPKIPGVYRVGEDLELLPANRLAPGQMIDGGHSLLLLHGTFSSTEGAFSALRGTNEWGDLVAQYEGRIFSLEHKTLSASPLENALDLAAHLPQGATLDLISHSRGGLVGEFLGLAAAGLLEPSLHKRIDPTIQADEVRLLEELSGALSGRSVAVNRYVRVASPASGTILASSRIDEVGGFLFNVVEKIPNVAGWIFTVLKSLTLAFLNQRTKPDVIPGLEAMMPTSAFIRLLNASGSGDAAGGFDDGLGVIAGDVDKSRWFKWFLEKGADLFYGEEHDYVVDTLSMYQGAQRKRAWVSFHPGPKVNHFTYFSEADTRDRVKQWLTADDPKETEFKPLDREPAELEQAMKKRRGVEGGPVVIVVPDFMGSSLRMTDETLAWPNPAHIVEAGLGKSIGKTATGLTAKGVLEATYGDLVARLQSEFQVVTQPYDWRFSLEAAAASLVRTIGDLETSEPIFVVAHGAGGLVVRHALKTSEAAREQVARILLLGCPGLGTELPLEWATGKGDLAEKLTLLDPAKTPAEIGRAFRAYDPVLELLPAQSVGRNPDAWADMDIRWKDAAERLRTSADLIKESWPDKSPPRIAVAGYGFPTPSIVEQVGTELQLQGRDDGDGTVTIDSAVAGSGSQYFVRAAHGNLPSHADAIDGYVDLVRDGRTNRLESSHPQGTEEPRLIAHSRGRQLFPSAVDLERSALGGRIRQVRPSKPGLRVEVVHGDLRFADHAVLVGHYKGSTMEGAEKALDRHLDGRLTERDVLGLYPGDVGKAEIVFGEPDDRPPAGVVVGMGEIGSITRAKVTTSVAEGAARVAVAELDRREKRRAQSGPEERISVGVSIVLIGTNGQSGLSIDDAVVAITAGVVDANRLLADTSLSGAVHIDRLQFVDLYEDVAIETLHAAHRMIGDPAREGVTATLFGSEPVSVARYLRKLEGGRSGQPLPEYNRGDWRPIMVESVVRCEDDPCRECEAKLREFEKGTTNGDDPESSGAGGHPADGTGESERAGLAKVHKDLTFTSIGLAARAERLVHGWQRDLVEKVIEKVVGVPNPDDQVYNTLYELLVPNYLKGATSDADNILLILDSEATRYPWEMLATRTATGEVLPIATRSGVVRRLISEGGFREPKRSIGTKALVIGDPPVGMKQYVRLPGAREEATLVANLLTARRFEVTSLIPEDDADHSLEILNALFSDEYRIIHIAAHGVYDDDPEQSGVVIGPNTVLSALSLRQLNSVPPLVFLNCCHLGAMDTQSRQFAASVSEQLIRDGVRAVVAAGWAVDDQAAARFAEVFYQEMLRGRPFGDAVKVARSDIYHGSEARNNTWGAYQCYGDPGFKLVARSPDGAGRTLVAPKELTDRLDKIRAWAANTQSAELGALAKEIDELLEETPAEWHGSAANYAAGAAYSEAGDFEKAITRYEAALAGKNAEAPIKLLEQLANLAGRRAVQLVEGQLSGKTPAADPDEIEGLIESAEQRLGLLLELTENIERPALMAAHHKRLAQADRSNLTALKKHLSKARGYYARARDAGLPAVDPYTTINAALFDLLVVFAGQKATGPSGAALQTAIDDSLAEARQRVSSDPSFWNRVATPDAELFRGLWERDLAARADEITELYQRAFDKRSTARERRSVIDHLWFLSVILERLAARRNADLRLEELSRACGEIHSNLNTQV